MSVDGRCYVFWDIPPLTYTHIKWRDFADGCLSSVIDRDFSVGRLEMDVVI